MTWASHSLTTSSTHSLTDFLEAFKSKLRRWTQLIEGHTHQVQPFWKSLQDIATTRLAYTISIFAKVVQYAQDCWSSTQRFWKTRNERVWLPRNCKTDGFYGNFCQSFAKKRVLVVEESAHGLNWYRAYRETRSHVLMNFAGKNYKDCGPVHFVRTSQSRSRQICFTEMVENRLSLLDLQKCCVNISIVY